MAKLPIYNCYHPVLKQKTNEIREFTGELNQLVTDMWDTLDSITKGVGLAANQVGKTDSVIIVDMTKDEDSNLGKMTFINPVIEFFSDEQDSYEEGCLSIPEFYEKVVRPVAVQIRYLDANMKEIKLEADEFLARVIQHEVDHLNGILFYERLTPFKRALSRGKLRRVEQGLILPEYEMVNPDGTLAQVEV